MAEKEYNVSWPGWNVAGIIGYGSYGRVYEIERNVFGHTEKAALKVISIPQNSGEIDELYNDGYDSESITQRFKSHLKEIVREYALMSEMKGHTNIVYCDDLRYIQHDDGMGWDIYIKMELLTPLPKILGNGFSEKLVVKLGLDICNALILCKSKNIVHRDIKPQNIFVSEDKNFKLGDFGIAKTAEHTTSGTKTGTYKYMAPEVYNNQPYGHAADIYSLGMVLYWLLNERRTPFLPLPSQVPTATDEERARDSRFAGFPIPEPIHGSEALKRIVLKACAFWPEERYKSAVEMRKDLLALASNGRYISQSQYIKSTGETESRVRISAADTDETVGNFGRVPKEETVSEKTVGVFARNTANKRSGKRKKNGLLILIGSMLCLVIFFLTFILGSAISYLHSVEKSKERNTEPLVNLQPESGKTGTIIATESTAAPEESTEVPTTAPTEDPVEMANRERYARAEALLADGKEMEAALIFRALGDYQDSAQRSFNIQIQQNPRNTTISAGGATVALKSDGTAIATGGDNSYNQWYVYNWDWKNIVSISAGSFRTLALRADGTVVNAGWSDGGKYGTENWKNIVAVAAGSVCAVGLKADGTVVATGPNYRGENNVNDWESIIAISAGGDHTVGLKADGTVVAAGDNTLGQCDVNDWTNIVAISAGNRITAGLKADGTVVSTRYETNGWTDIIDIASGTSHIVGLKADGTVVSVGSNFYGECDVSDWTNIVAISASTITMGLRSDGTVVAAGGHDSKQVDVGGWSDIRLPESRGNPTTDAGGYRYTGKVVNTSEVKIYQTASANSAITTTLKNGESLVIYETTTAENMAWGRCDDGWVYLYYVDLTPVTSGLVDARVVYNENTIIYSDSNGNSTVGTYARMSVVDIYEIIGKMARTDQGWVNTDNLM